MTTIIIIARSIVLLIALPKFLNMYSRNKVSSPSVTQEELNQIIEAAGNGDVNAISCLACMYDEGINGFPHDKSKAFELFKQAAEGGNPLAMNNLRILKMSY